MSSSRSYGEIRRSRTLPSAAAAPTMPTKAAKTTIKSV